MINIHENIICPITHQIYYDPVTASDGQTYEKEAIEEWLGKNNISPLTQNKLNSNMYPAITVRNLVNELLKANPELKENQYKSDLTYNTNKKKIKEFIRLKNFYKLKDYNNYDLLNLITKPKNSDTKYLEEILINCKDESILKYIIDNAIDLECEDNSWRLIHYVCKFSTFEIIKYVIEKGVDLECWVNNWKPIHIICKYSDPDAIRYIINKNVDLECETNTGIRPIHFICKFSTPEIIEYIINRGIDLECKTKQGRQPIHYICKYQNLEMIKYISNKGVNLEVETNKKWKPIHYVCKFQDIEIIKFFIFEKGVKINKRTNDNHKPVHLICKRNFEDKDIKPIILRILTKTKNIKFIYMENNDIMLNI